MSIFGKKWTNPLNPVIKNFLLIIKIINEKTYDQGYTGPSINNTSGASGNVNSTELFQACEEQAQWMKNYHYEEL